MKKLYDVVSKATKINKQRNRPENFGISEEPVETGRKIRRVRNAGNLQEF